MRLSGGKAANVAYMARRLGVPAQVHGRVGEDDLREQALQPLREIGTDLAGVTAAESSPTGMAAITVFPDGSKTIVLSEMRSSTAAATSSTTTKA